jgi:hypothetical protein
MFMCELQLRAEAIVLDSVRLSGSGQDQRNRWPSCTYRGAFSEPVPELLPMLTRGTRSPLGPDLVKESIDSRMVYHALNTFITSSPR